MTTQEFDEEAFECPFETVSSLRRVQTLYGAMAEAVGTHGEQLIHDDFQVYVTPGELDGFVAEDSGVDANSLVTVHVDLTTDTPSLEGVSIRPLREDLVARLGFSRYPWGRGIDNSITRRGAKGGSTRSTMQTYCVDCLERWTNADGREPAVGRIAEEHPDGWIIKALQALGQQDNIEERIESELKAEIDAEASPRVVATVALRLDPEDLSKPTVGDPLDGEYYPGQLHVLNAGMQARKEEKLARKNLPDSAPPSRGTSSCLVTGETDDVFGTAEDPLALFTVQHTEKFPRLEKSESWRTHPISSKAALFVQSGASLIDQCRTTRGGRSVYTIPYTTTVSEESAANIYAIIRDTDTETQAAMAKLQRRAEDHPEFDSDLRFYLLSVRNDSGDINVLHEQPDATITPARTIADHHVGVTNSSTFNAVAGFRQPADWAPIAVGTTPDMVAESIVSGRYAWGTVSENDADAPPIDAASEWLTYSLIAGDSIPVDRLLDEYITRLNQERTSDDDDRLSENHLKAQYAQLQALAGAGKLHATTPKADGLTSPARMHDTTTTDPELPPVDQFVTDHDTIPLDPIREYRLNRFLEERSAFDDTERRSAFLAGVLVGQIATHQADKRDMNQTALAAHPAERMSGRRIRQLVIDLVDKANVYAMDTPGDGSLFPELEDRVPETLSEAPMESWQLSKQDLRFHYALGQLYGKRAQSRAYDLREQLADEADIDTN
ncbi:TM1802 family CRISPR-associated protein [Halorubellus sp. PRR65]|uniref:TM1802 family CRISPR-associated protein n=1 Tax=Halorubellus sp. PRR65 TaxID=3098148 RepID=UPI002B25D9C7|nr:TM1802 family CRISPR-associated protein [Halorubellus sp. PRR65]